MLGFSYILGALSLASVVSSTAILLPLYSWPEDNSTWSPVYKAAAAHPDILFQVIVNPDSGPGETTYPDDSYIASVAQLNSYSNVEVIGYIPTGYGTRDISSIKTAIATYSNWSSYKAENITISGIFFDEAPRTNDDTLISYMQEVSESAKSSSLPTVVFNPGTKLETGSAAEYFKAADLIVEFENSYSTWTSIVPADEISDTYYDKAAILLYSAPLTADYEAVVHEAQGMGLGAAYLTNGDDYKTADSLSKVAASFVQADGDTVGSSSAGSTLPSAVVSTVASTAVSTVTVTAVSTVTLTAISTVTVTAVPFQHANAQAK
ncbi:uncharacterized protein N7443_008759 [Penicillium atrosanguineum]|uniref:uncharacterized protein n=1 Tax=Penicillium atrosanguineum TaxID=1132637 RepID=UPI0023860C66|nr:uncharacterized protein N7443_008759 [Penicillium atrosanguineum]KAJ5292806.1 hypothetical protein N7443_008759 [Penicillium atrosanguineum]